MNNSESLQLIAQKVISKIDQKDNENFGFVITILMIISICLTLIRVIQECNKKQIKLFDRKQKYEYFGSEIKVLSIKQSWFTKLTAKRIIRKTLNNREYYNEYGKSIMDAILSTAQNLTDDEIITLVEAANV